MSMELALDPKYTMDFAERLSFAQRRSGLGVQEIADRLDVSRNAVSTWINGRNKPRPRDLKAFALLTGYPVLWLETGEAPHGGGAPTGGSLPGLDSNQEPIG
ncbi:helix-turn-helix domain-containing protein [Microbacterium dauci]|uniref:helix-turn-helix domain-containing protein n=1 Tax=Microbacterium dauci TaxID=3048008 RepID=UPI003D2F6171